MSDVSENPSSLTDTMPRSNPQSPESIMQMQSETIMKMQEQLDRVIPVLEHLRIQGRPADQNMIQQQSSEISELRSALQEAKKKIQQQSDRIAKLNGNDIELQRALKIKKDSEHTIDQYTKLISDVNREKHLLDINMNKLHHKQAEYEKMIANEESLIEGKVRDQVHREKIEIEKNLEDRIRHSYICMVIGLVCGSVMAFLSGIRVKAFLSDLNEAWELLVKAANSLFDISVQVSGQVWELHEAIQIQYLDRIVAGILTALAFLLIILGIPTVILILIAVVYELIKDVIRDDISAVVAIAVLDLTVVFIDLLDGININFIPVWMLAMLVYVVLRFRNDYIKL